MTVNDTPLRRVRFVEMSPADQEAFLNTIRERRLKPVVKYQEAVKAKEVATHDKHVAQLEKKAAQFEKKADAVDKHIEQLEVLANEMQALRLLIEATQGLRT